MLVSLKVAIPTAASATPLGVAAAYAIHNGEHPWFRRLYGVLLLPMMVPSMIIAIGVFYMYARLNLVGTWAGLVAAHLMLAVPVLVVTTPSGLRVCDPAQELVARSPRFNRLRAL